MEGGGVRLTFVLLILSPKLLKYQIPYVGGGGGKLAFQLSMLCPSLLKSKILSVRSFTENFLSFCHTIKLLWGVHCEYSMVPVH